MSAASITPRVRTILLCNRVRESAREEVVFDLKGVRDSLAAESFPYRPRHLALFLVLTSPRAGRHPGSALITEMSTGRAVFQQEFDAQFDEDLGTLYLTVPIRCKFERPGSYHIEIRFFQYEAPDVIKGEQVFKVFERGE